MIRLRDAEAIATATLAAGRDRNAAWLAVVVLDAGGHLVTAKREDGAGLLRIEIATAKAYGALGMGMDSREIAARAQHQPTFFAALAALTQGRVAPAAGGVLIRDAADQVIGAVGVSGDTSEVDEECAQAGIAAAG